MKAKELRSKAWNALKGRYWWTVLAALVAWIFSAVAMFGSGSSAASADETNQVADALVQQIESAPTGIQTAIFVGCSFFTLVAIAIAIVAPCIRLGYLRFNLDLFTDVEKPSMGLLFSRTGILWKALWLDVLKGLKILAWSLLFVVPGIIAAFRYSQAEYILAENPDLSAKEAINKSKEIMAGNKWRRFCFDLSYIGWYILAGFAPVAGPLLLTPYKEAGDAGFYLDLTKRLDEKSANLSELTSKA